jgi:transposase
MKKEIHYQQVIEVGCGLDVHKDTIVATIRSSNKDYETKEFSSFTSSLTELRDWCKQKSVTHIAMESTGIYWKPVYNVLEDEAFEIILVNARHVKNIPGHKTDKKDSAWLSKLLLSGLLKGSFIPPVDIRELRDLVRYKKKKTQVVAAEKNRMIKILEDCNVKLSSVVSNVQGVSATKMVTAITKGETDIEKLILFAHGTLQTDKATIKKALEGKVTEHHRFMLQMARESIEVNEALITKLDAQIEKASERYKVELNLLQTIDGVGKDSAIAIISEIGADMKQFPNEHHLASWSGVSPGNNESGGKKKAQEPFTETNTYNQP